MSPETITLLTLAAVVVLFVWNRYPVEVIAIGAALVLYATGVLTLPEALAGFAGSGRGVDSTAGSDTAQSAAEQLARTSGAIVAVTGETDFITDGELTWATPWGHPIMTRVVGTGCALSALVAAFTAQAPNRLNAVAAACAVAGLCGERAAASSRGPGSFKADFLDALYRLSPETLREHAE